MLLCLTTAQFSLEKPLRWTRGGCAFVNNVTVRDKENPELGFSRQGRWPTEPGLLSAQGIVLRQFG